MTLALTPRPEAPSWRRFPAIPLAFLLLALLPALAAAAPVPNGQGLLWRIEADGRAPSFLLGTMHSTDPAVLDLPAPVAGAFASARSLTVELMIDEAVRADIGRAMLLADGRRLDQIVGAERFGQVARIGQLYGWPAAVVQLMKPWALMTIFGMPPEELARQAAGILPLDQMLQDDAERRGLAVFQLESAEEQFAIFDKMPEADQIAFLDMVVSQHSFVEQQFAELRRLYLARDTGGMMALMRHQAAGSDPELLASFEDRLLNRRNRLMAERMAARLQEGGAFVAVGALHLPGETGLVRLLAQAGYRLTALY